MGNSSTIVLIILAVCLLPSAWVSVQEMRERGSLSEQVSAYQQIADAATSEGDRESAIVALRAARRLQPARMGVERKLLLSECALSAEKPQSLTQAGALSLPIRLKVAGLTAGDSPEVAVALGQIEVFHGRTTAAKALFEAAVQDHPKSALAHYCLAKTYLLEKKLEEASKSIESAIDLEPKSALYRQAQGRTLSRQEKWGGAVEAFARATEIKESPLGFLQLGEAQLKLGNHEAAVRSLERAKEGLTKPELIGRARSALGFAFYKGGKLPESAVELEAAARVGQDSGVLFNLGKVRYELGQHRLSMLAFQAGLKGQPGNTGAHVELMRALLGLGQKEHARKVRARLVSLAQRDPAAKGDLQRADALLGIR